MIFVTEEDCIDGWQGLKSMCGGVMARETTPGAIGHDVSAGEKYGSAKSFTPSISSSAVAVPMCVTVKLALNSDVLAIFGLRTLS